MRVAKIELYLLAITFLIFVFVSPAFALIGKPLQQNLDTENKPAVIKPVKKAVKAQNNGLLSKAKAKNSKLWKKIHKNVYENIKNNAPISYEDYLKLSKEKKRSDFEIPEPKYAKDPKIVDIPDPHLRIVKYNVPAGARELNLNDLVANRKANSMGILSPDYSKMIYSTAFYYPDQNQISSDVYLINIDNDLPLEEKIQNAHELDRVRTPLLSTEFYPSEEFAMKTFVPLDWSNDGSKIAIKEKIGSTIEGIWQTNLWVYDFNTKQPKKLNEIREAIKYWWKANRKLDLVDYMWDIYPVGWDASHPDRIIVYAYAFTSGRPKFLGTWSIDYKGQRSELLSLQDTNFLISTNGLTLKSVIRGI